ncbi:mandelate racemase/muconate lactonizing enzyme family protein [Prosthecodimorpha staleyi]|uniref:Mandelate racemase/muconate lactonizing enzyme family protein n=1 Tax=Prosthecodimorpha staleyi TaxID=2840188 RepID=A0A947CZY0_9HYPH|nr:mandelate racemase/muconate lactonizing enzyme family protein [Prosthecodimorpha staleyi]MBT9288001.1 mandelate racemase/muconate lactonizing enzyme family protein [Prosthecodimorpha staleyi]
MKITAIEITHHRLPLDPPFNASWDTRPRTHFDATIVRVKTDEGFEGIASGDTMTGFAGHEPMFVGQDPLAIERHYRILSNIQFHYGRCWPLDLALWDLAGKIAGQPVWKLLGGLSDRVRAYASSGTLRAPAALADAAEAYLAQGFKALKIRFHRGDWRADVAALEAVRARVGDRLELMVDCNQGWRMSWDAYAPWSLKDALQVAREMERLRVYWMEEPLFRADRDGMRRLREMVDVRIAGGEMTREIYEFRDLIRDGCLDVVQPDAALVGGISGLRRVAAMAEAANVVFTPHTWTNGMGVVANAHLTCGLADAPFMEFPFDPPEWSLDRRDFPMRAPLEIDADGFVVLSDRPGMGYELDEDRLAATRIG